MDVLTPGRYSRWTFRLDDFAVDLTVAFTAPDITTELAAYPITVKDGFEQAGERQVRELGTVAMHAWRKDRFTKHVVEQLHRLEDGAFDWAASELVEQVRG